MNQEKGLVVKAALALSDTFFVELINRAKAANPEGFVGKVKRVCEILELENQIAASVRYAAILARDFPAKFQKSTKGEKRMQNQPKAIDKELAWERLLIERENSARRSNTSPSNNALVRIICEASDEKYRARAWEIVKTSHTTRFDLLDIVQNGPEKYKTKAAEEILNRDHRLAADARDLFQIILYAPEKEKAKARKLLEKKKGQKGERSLLEHLTQGDLAYFIVNQ